MMDCDPPAVAPTDVGATDIPVNLKAAPDVLKNLPYENTGVVPVFCSLKKFWGDTVDRISSAPVPTIPAVNPLASAQLALVKAKVTLFVPLFNEVDAEKQDQVIFAPNWACACKVTRIKANTVPAKSKHFFIIS